MRFIRELNPENRKLLERMSQDSKSAQVRQRAKCIILRDEKFSIKQLMKIFGVSRKTISNWLTKWEDEKLLGLYNNKGRGRKPKLTDSQKERIKEWVKQEPKSLNKVLIKIEQNWNLKISKETLKRIIKKFNFIWKRTDISRWRVQLANRVLMKRGLSKLPDVWELEVKIPKLTELKEKEQKGEIDLRYLDESGFSLRPDIRRGWQEKSQPIILKSCQSQRINVLGLMNRNLELDYEIYSGKIDSKIVINFLDKFSDSFLNSKCKMRAFAH